MLIILSNYFAHYLINVISPFLVVFVPSKNSTLKVYAYTSIGCITPFTFPSQPWNGYLVSNTFCPQRFQIINCILAMPKPFTIIYTIYITTLRSKCIWHIHQRKNNSSYLFAERIRTTRSIICRKTCIECSCCIILMLNRQS